MPKNLEITFTDSPEEEVKLVQRELSLSTLAIRLEGAIMKGEELSEDDLIQMAQLVTSIREMFSVDLPSLGENTTETLRMSSRDINVSRLLRERGLARLYRFMRETTPDGLPLYMTYMNPYNDAPFQRKEDFVGWIAKDAHIPRTTMFMRFSTYDKLLAISFDLEEAFRTVITKPYAMRDVLNMAAEWDKTGQISNLDPEIAKKVISKVLPQEEASKIIEIADQYIEDQNPVTMKRLVKEYAPVLKEFIEELAEHQNTKDMMDYVRHDVLSKPEISYSWVDESLVMHVTRKATDPKGVEVTVNVDDIPFIPDYPKALGDEVVDDLLNRLPIRNRREVLAERERRKAEDLDTLPF